MLRQMNDYMLMSPYYFEELKRTESKAEKLSYKQRIIDDIKKSEYPKGIAREMIKYVRSL